MHCPKCNSKNLVKNGFVREKQRHKCRGCSYEFTRLTPRGKAPELKQQAITLYLHGLSMRTIAKLLGVVVRTISVWVKKSAQSLPEPKKPDSIDIVELDELCHFVGQKNASSGYGLLWIETQEGSSTGSAVVVAVKRWTGSLFGSRNIKYVSTAQTTGRLTLRSFLRTVYFKAKQRLTQWSRWIWG